MTKDLRNAREAVVLAKKAIDDATQASARVDEEIAETPAEGRNLLQWHAIAMRKQRALRALKDAIHNLSAATIACDAAELADWRAQRNRREELNAIKQRDGIEGVLLWLTKRELATLTRRWEWRGHNAAIALLSSSDPGVQRLAHAEIARRRELGSCHGGCNGGP